MICLIYLFGSILALISAIFLFKSMAEYGEYEFGLSDLVMLILIVLISYAGFIFVSTALIVEWMENRDKIVLFKIKKNDKK